MSIWVRRLPGRAATIAVAAVLAAVTQPVRAQMALPGAVAPTPEGTVVTSPRSAGSAAAPKKKRAVSQMGAVAGGPVVMAKAPSADTIVGKGLKLDGSGSEIELAHAGADLQVNKLTLAGYRMTRSGEECRVDVAGMPLKVTARDGDSGLRRYQIDFPACPFSFDILDGAILVTNEGKACEIKAADCHAEPEGLWGMGETEFDPKKGADMLGARAKVEKTVRGNFRALYQKHQKEKDIRDYVVKEQAGFSSWREEVCRSYAKESDYGYCALRLTEARAIALSAQLANGVQVPEVAAVAPESVKPVAEKTAAGKAEETKPAGEAKPGAGDKK